MLCQHTTYRIRSETSHHGTEEGSVDGAEVGHFRGGGVAGAGEMSGGANRDGDDGFSCRRLTALTGVLRGRGSPWEVTVTLLGPACSGVV